MQEYSKKNHLALIAAVIVWSSAFVVSKVALTGIGPVTLTSIRIIICFILLLPFTIERGFRFRNLFRKESFAYGIFGYGGNLMLLTLGLTACSAGISAISHGLFPVFPAYIPPDEDIKLHTIKMSILKFLLIKFNLP